jgi:hypothetical protein
MPNHNAAVPSPELVDREIKVLELRRAGLTWQRIAEQVGYADHTGAYAAYKRAIKRTQQQPADELREAEIDRLDRLQLAVWPKAMNGDNNSITTILRIMERRARLLGLDMPVKIAQDVTVWEGGESIDRAVRDLADLLRQNAATSPGESAMAGDTGEAEPITTGDTLASLADPVGARLGQDENRGGVDSLASDNQPQDTMGSSS